MNDLSARFLAHVRKPKIAVPLPEQPKPPYPIEGYLDGESSSDRQGRLTEALAKGFELSEANLLYWRSHLTRKFEPDAFRNGRKQLRAIDKSFRVALGGTKPCSRG